MNVCWSFLDCADRSPDSILVHHLGKDTDYACAATRARNAAAAFVEAGLKPQDRVGILLDNQRDYIIAYFAVLLAGGIVVALNPTTTERELQQTLVHAEPKFVIFGKKSRVALEPVLPDLPGLAGIIGLDGVAKEPGIASSLFDQWTESNSKTTLPKLYDHWAAQIIYTSGTTGRPKGVTLTHRNLQTNTSAIVDYLRLTPADSVFTILPFYYSYGNSLLLTHATVGGKLILASDFVFWNRAVGLMQEQRATGFSGVPSTFAMLFHRSKFESMEFPALRYVTCAGGALPTPLIHRLRKCLPGTDLFLMYGQTEATARLSTLLPQELDSKPGSIGRGIQGVELQVLDESLRPTPPGTIGEIYARGPNIMQGYWKDDAATESVKTAAGLRTGDLAQVDEEGYIYIVGRSSDMIKSGGYRVNPHEIEDVILEFPGVEEVAVVGEPDEFLGEAIVAYAVTRDPTIEAQRIIDHCKRVLPAHKQLRRVAIVPELPKTSSGKIRRAVLRQL